LGATTVETASSRVPMLSNATLVFDVIRKAANAVQKGLTVGPKGVEGNGDECEVGPERFRETVGRRSLFLICF
jgi:hypothetical protein